MNTKTLALAGALLGAASLPFVAFAAFAPGGAAYTKRPQTSLLAEPKPLAAQTARVPYASKLTIQEIRGPWLKVTDGKVSGWVFAGNVGEEKPSETKGLDGLPIAASQTSATAAARPLTPAATEYGARHGLANATADVQWLETTSDAITVAQVDTFLQQQKKGEFQ